MTPEPIYRLVYSVDAGSCGSTFALLGLLPIGVGVLMLFMRPRSPLLQRRAVWYPVSLVLGGCAWSLAGLLLLPDCARLRDSLEKGRTEVVEGVVERYEETAREAAFSVGGRSFSIEPYRIGPGYKRLRRDGSPLHDGVRVRLHCLGQELLTIEVAE